MKKTVVVLGLICTLSLSACQGLFTPTPAPGPTVDTAATSDSLFKTAVVQTLTAQPTVTVTVSVPPPSPSPTAVVAVASPTLPVMDTPVAISTLSTGNTPTATLASAGDNAATATGNFPTATVGPISGTATSTLAAGQVTAIWTLAVRKYGTLPPAVPFSSVTLVNKANAEAYISLQVTMPDGKYSVIEYPVKGSIKIQAPVGSYLYVAWVGGNKMVGNFRLHQDDDLSIILYKDKIVIK
jgi:hypothetical protein